MRWEQLGQNFADLAKRRHEFEEIVDRLEMAAAGQRRDDGELARLKNWVKEATIAEIGDLADCVRHCPLGLPSNFQPIFAQAVCERVVLLKHELDTAHKIILDNLPDKDPEQRHLPLQVQSEHAPA